jgi:hypothetical protein
LVPRKTTTLGSRLRGNDAIFIRALVAKSTHPRRKIVTDPTVQAGKTTHWVPAFAGTTLFLFERWWRKVRIH